MGLARVCVVTGFGINADRELARAFEAVGGDAFRLHLLDLVADPGQLDRTEILALPGGFSFGDHLGAGLVFAARFRHHLAKPFFHFIARGGLTLGICNGFQILAKMGAVPGFEGDDPQVSLVHNESGRFVDSWVRVSFDKKSPCIWTRGLDETELPIRHGEGRFVASERALDQLETEHLVAVRYEGNNPNGSMRRVAGVTSRSGRLLGLMPHPEAFLAPHNHPRWSRETVLRGEGLELLRNGVREAKGG